MRKGDVVTFTAQSYSNAETVGQTEGVTLFVPQLLVGEKALVKVNFVKGNVAYGNVVQVLQPSALRAQPPCKHFGKCGGCGLMHMQYAEQLNFKRQKVQRNLQKIGNLNCQVLPCRPSPKILGYRNKLSLPVRGKKGKVQIGMYQKGSHSVVDMDSCQLGGGWNTTLVRLFRNYLNAQGVEPYNEKTFCGQVRHLVARFVEGQLLVTVVSNGSWHHDLQPFAAQLSKHFEKFGLFVNENTLKNNVILGAKTTHICGIKHIEGQHLGVKFRLRPDSFFQVNDGVKNLLYSKVQQLLDLSQTEVLVDCFSGIGVLTNVLASPRYQTYAVEIVPQAVEDAKQTAKLNHTPNVTNICGDAEQQLPIIAAHHAHQTMTLVVDPPRKGLGTNLCNTILQANFNNVVYISCDSATLARDLALLCTNYNVAHVEPWDMFPNTAEVETLCLLVRK